MPKADRSFIIRHFQPLPLNLRLISLERRTNTQCSFRSTYNLQFFFSRKKPWIRSTQSHSLQQGYVQGHIISLPSEVDLFRICLGRHNAFDNGDQLPRKTTLEFNETSLYFTIIPEGFVVDMKESVCLEQETSNVDEIWRLGKVESGRAAWYSLSECMVLGPQWNQMLIFPLFCLDLADYSLRRGEVPWMSWQAFGFQPWTYPTTWLHSL